MTVCQNLMILAYPREMVYLCQKTRFPRLTATERPVAVSLGNFLDVRCYDCNKYGKGHPCERPIYPPFRTGLNGIFLLNPSSLQEDTRYTRRIRKWDGTERLS